MEKSIARWAFYKEKMGNQDRIFEGVRNQVMGMKYPAAINHHNTSGELREFIDIIS